jgi:glycosyltransferase involved in cell wall biosynthesis
MIKNKKVVVVMPAYNAAKTLKKTYAQIPHEIVDGIILVDDRSSDETIAEAKNLNLKFFVHDKNKGYGANQKTCYQEALKLNADIVIMLHPDYQYDPRLITALASLIAEGVYDVVLGSRILGGESMRGGMPVYKYIANRCLTLGQNFVTKRKISEYHTGYRAFSRQVLTALPLANNSNDFVFDNQMLLQAIFFNFKIGEVSCPTRYEADSSSINFRRSAKYGLGVILASLQFFLAKKGVWQSSIFKNK